MRKKNSKSVINIQKYSELLLYEASGGRLGTPPKELPPDTVKKPESMTFGEKRSFLDSLVKIAELERKSATEEEEESFFDKMQKKAKPYAGTKSSDGRNSGADTADSADESGSGTGEDSEGGEDGEAS